MTFTSNLGHGWFGGPHLSPCWQRVSVALTVRQGVHCWVSSHTLQAEGSCSQPRKECLPHFFEIRWWWEQELLLQAHHSLLFPPKRRRKSSGKLSWNITGRRGELEKPFISSLQQPCTLQTPWARFFPGTTTTKLSNVYYSGYFLVVVQ